MSFTPTELRVLEAIDNNCDRIIGIAKEVQKNPELGYREFNTSKLVKEVFENLGLETKDGIAYTGVKGVLGKNDNFNVSLIGELDSVICFDHPYAVFPSGAAHACGHHAQIANLVGAAIGLAESGVGAELDGKITFMAVPAEEYIELEYRQKLKDEGKIKFFSGKQQMIYDGEFDDVDAAIMVHAQPENPDKAVYLDADSLGFVKRRQESGGKFHKELKM